MDNRKYIGMDVRQASISVTVRDGAGKLVMECIIETKAATVLEFIRGLRGDLWVAFEEGTSAAWLYALVKPHVARVVVCDPRKNALLKAGNKNDRVDARKLSELLRAELLVVVGTEHRFGIASLLRPGPQRIVGATQTITLFVPGADTGFVSLAHGGFKLQRVLVPVTAGLSRVNPKMER